MLKFVFLLLTTLVIATSAQDDLQVMQRCFTTMADIEKHCLEHSPDYLKTMKNAKDLVHHPELCCDYWKMVNCVKDGGKKTPCQKYMAAFEKTATNIFTSSGCKVESCH